MVNIVAVDAAGYGSVTAWPTGGPRPGFPYVAINDTSNLSALANVAIVAVSDDGRINIGVDDSAMHVVVDLLGVYTKTDVAVAAGRVMPSPHYRAYDSRQSGGTFAAQEHRVVSVDHSSLPADATAIIATLTVTNTTTPGFCTALAVNADDGTEPETSSVNVGPGSTRANQVAGMIPITPANREVVIFPSHGGADAILDVAGYVTGPTSPVSAQGLYTQLRNPVEVFAPMTVRQEASCSRWM